MRWIEIVTVLALLGGCALKEPVKSKAALVVLHTPSMRYAQTGFIRQKGERVELWLYSMATSPLVIRIGESICLEGSGCMGKEAFNARFLSPSYPENLLKNILLGRPIFGGMGMERREDGFRQRIFSDDLDIIYRVSPKKIYFKDRKNDILIKIKELDG